MATRIKRYEERRERMPDLLARIEREMGPDAQVEHKFFKRGALFGFIGGLSMVEVVATVEVSDEQLRIGNYNGAGQGAQASPANAQAVAQENIAAAELPPAKPTPPRMVPPPGELKARQQSQPGRIDVRAGEPLRVSMASGGLELEPEPPQPKPVKPQQSKPQAKPVAPEPSVLNEKLPEALDPAPVKAAATPVDFAVEQPPEPVLHDDLAELKESISELKETIKLLAQAQAKAAKDPAAPGGAKTGEATPAARPSGQESSDENPLPVEISEFLETEQDTGPEYPADDDVEEMAGTEARPDGKSGTAPPPAANLLALDPGAALDLAQRQAYERLLDWNIGPYDALELINSAMAGSSGDAPLDCDGIIKAVTGDICRNILLSGGIKLGQAPPGRVVALVGATGVGKTTTIAKLAAKFAFQEGRRVSLISLDNYRIAAAEQLRTYGEIMGIDLDIVFSKDEFDAQLTQRRHSDLVLIDTAGRSPINTKQIHELREFFSAHPPDEVHLVVSASTKGDDLRAILENFEPLGYGHIIVSKLDETRSLGAVYNISKYSKCPISYVTVGQRVPEDIRTATLPFIQQWIEQGTAL